jgi:hypothetical protein
MALAVSGCRTGYASSLLIGLGAGDIGAARLGALTAEVCREHGLRPVSTHSVIAQFETPPYPSEGSRPHLIVTVDNTEEPRGLRVAILNLSNASEVERVRLLRDDLESAVRSECAECDLRFRQGKFGLSLAP